MRIRQELRQAMLESMEANDKVVLIGEEVGAYNGAYKITEGLHDRFGSNRVIDTPITEAGFAGLGIGMAFAGMCPIVEFMTFNFSSQAFDQIVNSAAKTNYMSGGKIACPIVFRGPNGPAFGVGAQHSQCYASTYSHIPGLKVIAPYVHSGALLREAISDPNPVVFLENEILYGQRLSDFSGIEPAAIGKSYVLRSGNDVTIVGMSITVPLALKAADELAGIGISCEVIDLSSLRPLDENTILTSLAKTSRILIVAENWPFCGITSEIAKLAATKGFDYLDAPPECLSLLDIPAPYSKLLEQAYKPCIADVVEAAKRLCDGADLTVRGNIHG